VAIKEPFPELDEILASIGEGGQRVATIDAAEGAAGNISVCIGWPIEIRRRFPVAEEILLPVTAPRYEYMDLVNGERAEGLTIDEMRAVVEAFDVKTTIV
jgi:hypothetical protein